MKYTIKAPSHLNASINLPASKSISNRALVISAMAGSDIQPNNLSDCDDTEVIIAALKNMPEVINIKAAGTAMRFMTAYLASTEGEHSITGTERMQNRPIGILVDALRYLGADITYERRKDIHRSISKANLWTVGIWRLWAISVRNTFLPFS